MSGVDLKKKIMVTVAIIGALLIIVFQRGIYSTNSNQAPQPQTQTTEEPGVVSTNPPNLENQVITPNQIVEITFNLPIENIGEFKNKLDPKPENYQVKLSDDRKTAQIIPIKPFNLGTTFTLFIQPDTKFDGKKTLGKELIYHFRTIEYKGV